MTQSRGLERYQRALVDWISANVSVEHLKGLASYDDDQHKLIDTVFRRFTELTECVDRLDLCLKFIGAPMPRRKGLKADDYLMYHITFYLQEVFVLEERCRAYATTVLRLRKKRIGLRPGDSEAVDQVLAFIRETLSKVPLARGEHVHSRAFRDEEMKDLSMFSFLSMHDEANPEWRLIAKHLYRDARSRWVKQIGSSREAITDILDLYSDLMFSLVFEGSPSLLPNSSSKPTPLRGAA